MMLGELEGPFPYGLALITDRHSTEQIPAFAADTSPVTAGKTAIVVTVRPEVDGSAHVRLWDSQPDDRQPLDYGEWAIDCPSGQLRLSTADGSRYVDVNNVRLGRPGRGGQALLAGASAWCLLPDRRRGALGYRSQRFAPAPGGLVAAHEPKIDPTGAGVQQRRWQTVIFRGTQRHSANSNRDF